MANHKKFSSHSKVRQDNRPNGKAWKQHPKAFDYGTRKLVTVGNDLKGESGRYV